MLAEESKTSEPMLITKDILCGNMFELDEDMTLKQVSLPKTCVRKNVSVVYKTYTM